VAGLLVSVRSAAEARAALSGGAAIIDIKDPARGPLGMADARVWREVVESVEGRAPVSVAMGELVECEAAAGPDSWAGLHWRKLGLAGIGGDPRWRDRWAAIRAAWPGPPWIAVAYADFEGVGAPAPGEVVEAAIASGCSGVLFDTWEKGRPSPIEAGEDWGTLVERVHAAGLLAVLAGGLDAEGIRRLAPLRPDFFAVRGAGCAGGDRRGMVDAGRVRALAVAAATA
jgi:uncharacterized protein (UPF0264 family)